MKRKGIQIEVNEIFNITNTNKENKNNIILITHCKNKSVDLKHSFRTELSLRKTKINNSSNKKKYEKINNKKCKPKSNVQNINLLSKNNSFCNILNNNSNKKKYFFDENFFTRKNLKRKLNISFRKNSTNKKPKFLRNEPDNQKNINILDNSENIKTNKRILLIKNNNSNFNECSSGFRRNNNTEINNIKIHDILYDWKKEGNKKKQINKSNLIYIKNKIKRIPYRNKNCSTSRVCWSQKENKLKLKQENINNNFIIEDSLDSHNTIVDENNINEYKLFQQNLSHKEFNKANSDNEDKSFKNFIPKSKNIIDDSLNNKYHKKFSMNLQGKNQLVNKNYTPKTSRTNNEKYLANYGINLNKNFVYKKVNTQRLSATFNRNINPFLTSSLTTTRNQTHKNKNIFYNIVTNKDVTEFVYSDDLFENSPNNKKINIKNWLSNSGLYLYYQNFCNKNIYDLNSLINDVKKIKNKEFLFNYIENNFQIHLPGHIYRIIIKLEILEDNIDSKITNFFIKKEDNINDSNKIKPSSLLKYFDNCDNFIDYSTINKNNLKVFLKKYHLNHLYHNFYQNGFDLINFVILQMYSKNFAINDEILENCFHIYDQEDRNLVLNSLKHEKSKIDNFLNSKDYMKNNNTNNENSDISSLNSFNYYNNFDIYFSSKETNENSCKICNIF